MQSLLLHPEPTTKDVPVHISFCISQACQRYTKIRKAFSQEPLGWSGRVPNVFEICVVGYQLQYHHDIEFLEAT